MSYYMFTVKQRVAVQNHHEALNVKEGNSYALKELKKRVKEMKQKEDEIIQKIDDVINEDAKLLAVMRKLVVIAHSLYKSNSKYDTKVYQLACGITQTKSENKEVFA